MSSRSETSYVPLWCKSNYSFLEGASHPEELIEEAARLSLPALALTDRDGVYGIVRAHVKAKELGFPLILGAQVTVANASDLENAFGKALDKHSGIPTTVGDFRAGPHSVVPVGRDIELGPDPVASDGSSMPSTIDPSKIPSKINPSKIDTSTIVLLAATRGGYANLCRLLTKGRLRSPKGESVVSWDEVCAHNEGLIALWGGSDSLLVREADPLFTAHGLREAFPGRFYAMVTRHRRTEEVHEERRLRERARRYGLPTVAATEVLYHQTERRKLQDVLTCIRHGVTLTTAERLIRPNAEYDLKPSQTFAALFADDFESARRTREIAERCTFTLDEIRYRYPSERLPSGLTSAEWLRHLTFEGAKERYPRHLNPRGVPDNVKAQLDKELALIEELEYDGYFLTMWEIVQQCRRENILCQGRGSAANSAVCYCLGVTAIDPVRMGLLFERFLSRERAEPPDIDLDIEHERREEVIQHVYQKYGRSHAAMVANFIRYRARSAVRDVGKALGFPETEVDRLAKLLPIYDAITPEIIRQAGLDVDNRIHEHLLRLCFEIQDFPRHLSIHPGGFLLGHEPVTELVPVENATMPDRTVIQWDKEDLENLGLFKVDLLGLGALTQLHLCFDQLHAHWGVSLSMPEIPADDPETFAQIQKADTVGVFQIESRAQMAMVPRLCPKNYYDLVIEVSIVRPGPIAGGMVHPYLRRRNGTEPVTYPHPSLVPILQKTLGVPLFQEQVMQLAVVAADYTPGEADQLRRDMAAWRSTGRIERHRDRLISRMKEKGITQEFADRVFEQIRGFGEYGFPESHAASFALIAYATAWIRCHYLEAFVCSLLNAQPMGFYSVATIVNDTRRHGAQVRPIDVLTSDWDCTLESLSAAAAPDAPRKQFAVRMGLRYVKGLSEVNGRKIESERRARPFASMADFARRTGLDQGSLSRLAASGAFSGLERERRSALWASRALDRSSMSVLPLEGKRSTASFAPLSFYETICWDYDTTSHSPRAHPLATIRLELASQGFPDARTVNAMPDGSRVRYAGLVICRQRPGTASGVVFMTLEDETGFVNAVLWSTVFEKYAVLGKTALFVGITGKLQVESGVTHLVAESLWEPQVRRRPQSVGSRDFH